MRTPVLIALLCLGIVAHAQRSPFNGLQVLRADSNGHYRILIGGHFHGESTNRSGYPASTLLANLDTINKLGAHLFLSTGDLFLDPEKDRERYERAFFSKLKVPFFNAPGNHDRASSISDTVETFHLLSRTVIGSVVDMLDHRPLEIRQGPVGLVTLFDTEVDEGSFGERQLRPLRAYVEMTEKEGFKKVFIISHRPIWAEDDPQYGDLFSGNTRSMTGTNFDEDVYPLLEKIAEHAHVYWISGSLGGQAPASIFFQKHAKNITYIQCAIRDEPRDALLIADVYPDTVKWSALSLTGQQLLAPEAYNAAWWRENLGRSEGPNWRLMPYRIKSTLTHHAFWWGAGLTLLLLFLVARLWRARS